MKKTTLIIAIAFVALFLSLSECFSASLPTHAVNHDYASFESFYKEDLSLTSWVLAGALAVAGVVAVFFTMGAAAPGVATIGASIGSAMGLSGAAATSAGLAWLGGGALAAGGFGMVGGAALLTAVFEASIVGGTQYYQHYMNKKSYTELCEAVKDYPTLPPILNTTGPKEVEEIVVLLKENYDINKVPSFIDNINTVNVAISKTHRYSPESDSFYKIGYDTVIRREKLRIYTLQSILYFMNNDYVSAYNSALKAESYHNSHDDGSRSVIDFILSVSGLMTGKLGISHSIMYFKDSIIKEKDNQLTPLLFSIYISRAGALNLADSDFMGNIYGIANSINDDEIKSVVMTQVITASLSKIWEHQNNIQSIYDNIDLLDFNLAVKNANQSFDECISLINFTNSIITINIHSSNDELKSFYLKSTYSLHKYKNNNNNMMNIVEKIKTYKNNNSSCNSETSKTDNVAINKYNDVDTTQDRDGNKTHLSSLKSGKKDEVIKDDVGLYYVYIQAANDGDAEAQGIIGRCFEYGVGVKKDIHKAVMWYERAANQGDSYAKFRLANIGK